MKLQNKTDYSQRDNRSMLVDYLADILNAGNRGPFCFVPYRPAPNDDYFWTLDSGNDWKVKFFEDEPNHFEIIYRYRHKESPYENALAAWLKIRIGAEEVK